MILRTQRRLAHKILEDPAASAKPVRSTLCRQKPQFRGQSVISQLSYRNYSTPPTSPQETHPETVITPASPPPSSPRTLRSQIDPPPPPSPTQPRKRRRFGIVLLCAISLGIGLTAGTWVRYVIAPPPLPLPGTHEDQQLSTYYRSKGEQLPIVQSLEKDPEWKSWDAYSGFTEEEKKGRITTGPLGGVRGLGPFQRIFQNIHTGETISVVWIGGALAGFPGVCHGGLIATLMDESLGRCAIATFPDKTGVTANLQLSYLAPVVTNAFYVFRCSVGGKEALRNTERKAWVTGRWEGLDGRVHVEGKALFVVPKKVTLRKLEGF